jgi:Sulfotransferase family
MKSGTNYLSKLLGAHPLIFMSSLDEPSYFVEPDQLRRLWPGAWEREIWRSEAKYLHLFQKSEGAILVGETSTNYAKRPLIKGVPEKIRAFNPDARFIYILRDPVDRTISHYWHMVRHHGEYRPMLEAVKSEPQYLDVSNYAMQLEPFYQQFGSDRVAVLTFEQLVHSPVTTMRCLYDWLGVEGEMADVAAFGVPENVTPETLSVAAGRGILQYLRRRWPFQAVAPLLPHVIRDSVARLSTRTVQRRKVDTSEVKDFLRDIQQPQTETLSQLVGRDFSEWVTLKGGQSC